MAPTSNKERQRKWRARQKLKSLGKSIPLNLEVRKSGPTPSANSSATDLHWRRFKAEHSQIRGKAMVPYVRHTGLRKKSGTTSNTSIRAMNSIDTWANDMDMLDKDDLEVLKKGMFDMMKNISTSFKWFPTFEKGYVLFYVETVDGEEVFHPWFEVKQSEVAKDSAQNLTYGLFAARKFPKDSAIGLYVGEVSSMNDDVWSDFRLNYTTKVLIDIKSDDSRLCYGMGMHMANDFHYPHGYDYNQETNNNAVFGHNLAVRTLQTIMKGEEICISYNLINN